MLDRDGTLIVESGYLSDRRQLVLLPGVVDAVQRARAAGWVPVLVSNQSAVGRGLVTEEELLAMHQWLIDTVGLAAAYHCPHLPDEGCDCRKPKPGLLRQAVDDLDLDRSRSALVGDNITDIQAAVDAGVRPVLVRTGHGLAHEGEARAAGASVVDDLAAAVDLLLGGGR